MKSGAGRDKFCINTGTDSDTITDYQSHEQLKLTGGREESDLIIKRAGDNVKIKYENDLLAK